MEKKPFSTRKKARIILYLSAVIIVLGIVSITQTVKANKYKMEAIATKQMALVALDENLSNISTNLEKTIYVSTPSMLSKLSTELWREASGAKNSLALLPTDAQAISNTYKFLSQVGEFVMSLERKSVQGEVLTDEERNQLSELYSYCKALNEEINNMCYDMQNGSFSFEEVKSTISTDAIANTKTFSQGFDDTEQSLTDMPSLIYDGPFSDHLVDGKAKYTEGLSSISQDEAKAIAERICEKEKDSIYFSHMEEGTIPCYVLQSDNCTIAITKNGGKPCYMLNSTFVGEIQLEPEDVIEKAREFLDKIGYENMKESYFFTEDGICTINFASTKNDIVLYPDLIKVSVSLESGEVLSFDATGYIANHTERSNLSPALTREQAVTKINTQLDIIDVQLCVIPTEWQTEDFCYEVHCKTQDGKELLIYIDCYTGEEDNILILLYSDDGVLTK